MTEIIIILDRSGSMATLKEDVEGGLKEFVEKQQPDDRLTLVQFDSQEIEKLYDRTPVSEVIADIPFEPRGLTPLLDAVGQTLANRTDDKAICFIITDGMENASREYKRDGVKKLIEERTKKGWEFLYLGANVDAFDEAGRMGIAMANAAGYAGSAFSMRSALDVASSKVASYRAGHSVAYTDQERGRLMDKEPSEK